MIFYIFGGSYASKIPFYVNLLTKLLIFCKFVSIGNHQCLPIFGPATLDPAVLCAFHIGV